MNGKQITVPVQGMTCASCVGHVEGAIQELPGVETVVVNLGTGKATVTVDPERVTVEKIVQAVAAVGYEVPITRVSLNITGMTCASCVAHVEGALNELAGVKVATVNLAMNTARVVYYPEAVTISQMKRAVRNVGYEASEADDGLSAIDRERQAREQEIRSQWINLLIFGITGNDHHDRHILRYAGTSEDYRS